MQAEREFEESYPRRKEQHARELQEIKAANELVISSTTRLL